MKQTWIEIKNINYPYIIKDIYLQMGTGDFSIILITISIEYLKKWNIDKGLWDIDLTKKIAIISCPPLGKVFEVTEPDFKYIEPKINNFLYKLKSNFDQFIVESNNSIPKIEL